MGEFFRGWRRKVGVVTLLLALVLTAGWVRSQSRLDIMQIRRPPMIYLIASIDSGLWFSKGLDVPEKRAFFDWNSADMKSFDGYRLDATGARLPFLPSNYVKVDWRWDWAAFQFCAGASKYPPNGHIRYAAIPYWSITIPLTILSIFLLLSKPRNSTPKTIIEPTTSEGA